MDPARSLLLNRQKDAPRQGLSEYRQAGGYDALEAALRKPPSDVLDAVREAELKGRGGAAFPVAKKWELAAAASGTKWVIANGGEHEPGSDKDKFLVSKVPHAVLEGLLLAGYATGASAGWLYLIEDMADPLASAEAALEELRAEGLLGNRILDSDFSFDVHIHRAPTTYVAGEETAALESIEGRPALPRKKPPYPGTSGLHGQPTTVNNVETLAHVPHIVREGPAWYRGFGTDGSYGTMLFTLGSQVNNPGVFEVEFGKTLRHLLENLGGGLQSGHPVRAFQPALSCAFLGAEHLDTPLTHRAFKEAGSSLGCGGLSFVEEGEDVLERLERIARFFMDEQCGQCPPCRMETNHLAAIVKGVREGKGGDAAGQIKKITSFARGKGRCSLIEMAAAPMLSACDLFADDIERAARK